MSEPLLQVHELKKYFPVNTGFGKQGKQYVHAVDNVSFSMFEGETLGLVGESGCGKSTLGQVILQLQRATSGEILYKGTDLCKLSPSALREMRRELQIIFQDPYSSINPRKNIETIVTEPLVVHKLISRVERKDKAIELLEKVGLGEHHMHRMPHEFSGGQRQRIGIARALSLNPTLIVCDEPVSALDVSIQAQIINLLLDMQEEKKLTYVFITHDLMVVKYISTKIMVMYLGEVVEFADTEELFSATLHPYTKALLSAVPLPEVDTHRQRIVLEGEVTSPIDPPKCCRFCARCRYAKEKCHLEAPPLTEVLPGHMVKCHFVREINEM